MTQWSVEWETPLSPEDMDRIESFIPVCKVCQLKPIKMHWTVHQTRRLEFEIDGSRSISTDVDRILLNVGDSEYEQETIGATPVMRQVHLDFDVNPVPAYLVECINGHLWYESKLKREDFSRYWGVHER